MDVRRANLKQLCDDAIVSVILLNVYQIEVRMFWKPQFICYIL